MDISLRLPRISDHTRRGLLDAAETEQDPMWRSPLRRPYCKMIDCKIADINNVSESPHAGAVSTTLYLQELVEPGIPWAHLDAMAWTPQSRPGRPEGAEATALRALYAQSPKDSVRPGLVGPYGRRRSISGSWVPLCARS
jgi:leucyl aminopeptidase